MDDQKQYDLTSETLELASATYEVEASATIPLVDYGNITYTIKVAGDDIQELLNDVRSSITAQICSGIYDLVLTRHENKPFEDEDEVRRFLNATKQYVYLFQFHARASQIVYQKAMYDLFSPDSDDAVDPLSLDEDEDHDRYE